MISDQSLLPYLMITSIQSFNVFRPIIYSSFAWEVQRVEVYFIFYKALLRHAECYIYQSAVHYETS